MLDFYREIRVLREEGKLHARLITRVRMMFGISAILLGVVVFNLLFRSVNPFVAIGMAADGFVLGLFVFSRMTAVNWDEEKEVVQASRMDMLGYATLALYIVFEITFRTALHKYFPVSATGYLLSGIFGTIFGRAVGMVVEIHRVYLATHTTSKN